LKYIDPLLQFCLINNLIDVLVYLFVGHYLFDLTLLVFSKLIDILGELFMLGRVKGGDEYILLLDLLI
jgi:hypothetical protein